MSGLYQVFYDQYKGRPLAQLRELFAEAVDSLIEGLGGFSGDGLFQPGDRKWTASTNSNWPIWKWVHINTVAPFQVFSQ